jgi:hypothetical protein
MFNICGNGVLFYDIILKLSSRDSSIKGVNRKPKNNT